LYSLNNLAKVNFTFKTAPSRTSLSKESNFEESVKSVEIYSIFFYLNKCSATASLQKKVK
jgi:hypothetical protein